jgi:alpha-mannosidase
LWGRNYTVDGPTKIHYALLPHKGKWDKSGIWTAGTKWNEPLMAVVTDEQPKAGYSYKSLIHVANKGVEISAITFDGNAMLVRLFNAEGDAGLNKVSFDYVPAKVSLVELNGDKKQDLKINRDEKDKVSVQVSMPRFGFRTIRLSN